MDNFFFGNKSNNNYSRTYSKGTSFKFSVWNENDTYNNDEFVIDFVQWDKSLWAAKKTSTNIVPSEGDYWELIVKGVSDIEFRQIDNRIEYRYKDPTSEWKDLFELASVSEEQIKEMLDNLNIKYGNTYDVKLSETSTNAVQNQVVTKKFKELDDKNTKTDSELTNIKSSVNTVLSNYKSYTDSKISETKNQIDFELNKKANQTDVDEIVDVLSENINLKVDKVFGKGLSTNDFNDNYKSKLDNLDFSLNSTLTSAKSHTNFEITKVDNEIKSEISRAKTSETNLSDRIDDVEEDLVDTLKEAKEYTDSLANGEVKNNTNKINTLNGTGEGSVIKTVKDEIAKVVDAAPEELDTLREIAAKLADSEDVAAGLVETLSELENKKADKTALNNLKTETDSALQSLEKTKANTMGTYPLLHVGTADDLAGRGESVPASFGFRASGGKSIKDGRAYIKRIKGNSVVWNQMLPNSTNIVTSSGAKALNEGTRIVAGHKYLLFADFDGGTDYASVSLYARVNGESKPIFSLGNNEGKTYKFVTAEIGGVSNGTNAAVEGNIWQYFYFLGTTESITNTRLIDLTQMFGAGNEPTTIEEYEARKPIVEDEYAYNEGQVIHCNTESIKSVGDNAWDEQWEVGAFYSHGGIYDTTAIRTKNFIKVLPNTEYYINRGSDTGGFIFAYDKDFQQISGWNIYGNNKSFITPVNAEYIKFCTGTSYGTTYKNDIMVTLVHSGWKQDTDAGYQPYWADTLPLPIIRKYFPQGMKSAGTAKDEIRYNKASGKWEAVQRIGSVDMGSMAWSYDSANQVFTSYTIMDLMTHPAEVSERNKRLLCSKYSPSRTYIASTMDDKSWLRIPKSVTIKDTSYTDAATFKAAMQGVILYYELAEPIVTELDAEDQNFRDYYNVADFGTEQSQSSVPSAPFSADIIYQFNAVDMIREHEIEITDIKTSKQDFISDLSTIRSNAAKGATALQNVPSEYVKRSELTALQNEINALRAMIEEITIQE